jgi:hypothetical protein
MARKAQTIPITKRTRNQRARNPPRKRSRKERAH